MLSPADNEAAELAVWSKQYSAVLSKQYSLATQADEDRGHCSGRLHILDIKQAYNSLLEQLLGTIVKESTMRKLLLAEIKTKWNKI